MCYLSRYDEQEAGDEDGEADEGEAGAGRHPREEEHGGQGEGPDQDDQEEAHPESEDPGALLVLLHVTIVTISGMCCVTVGRGGWVSLRAPTPGESRYTMVREQNVKAIISK